MNFLNLNPMQSPLNGLLGQQPGALNGQAQRFPHHHHHHQMEGLQQASPLQALSGQFSAQNYFGQSTSLLQNLLG